MSDGSIWDTIVLYLATVAAWLGGESGRVMVAGGLGGLSRWLQTERRRIRDGVLAVLGGVIAAKFLWPIPFGILSAVIGPMDRSAENIVMAGFLAGALGMSFVKVLTATVEARVKKGGDDAQT